MQEELKQELRRLGFNRSCIKYIETRFNRRLVPITTKAIKAIDEDELLASWLSMKSVIDFVKAQNQIK